MENGGTFCANPKNLFDILRELPETKVTLSLNAEKSKLAIDCKDIHFSLLVHPDRDFPHLLFEEREHQFRIPADKLLQIIDKTFHAMSDDETRIYFSGMYLQEVGSCVRAVATDGNRLALIDTQLDENEMPSLADGVIVPKKGVHEFAAFGRELFRQKCGIFLLTTP